MRSYLDAMEGAHYAGVQPQSMSPPIIAALGPKMIGLAGKRGIGAHTYNSPVVHTATAHKILGEGPLLVPEMKVILGKSTTEARAGP